MPYIQNYIYIYIYTDAYVNQQQCANTSIPHVEDYMHQWFWKQDG